MHFFVAEMALPCIYRLIVSGGQTLLQSSVAVCDISTRAITPGSLPFCLGVSGGRDQPACVIFPEISPASSGNEKFGPYPALCGAAVGTGPSPCRSRAWEPQSEAVQMVDVG